MTLRSPSSAHFSKHCVLMDGIQRRVKKYRIYIKIKEITLNHQLWGQFKSSNKQKSRSKHNYSINKDVTVVILLCVIEFTRLLFTLSNWGKTGIIIIIFDAKQHCARDFELYTNEIGVLELWSRDSMREFKLSSWVSPIYYKIATETPYCFSDGMSVNVGGFRFHVRLTKTLRS